MMRPIIVIDDNPDDADIVRATLHRAHILNPILIYSSGNAGVAYFERLVGASNIEEIPMLVILDLGLPDMSGLDVLKVIRDFEMTKDVRVIILTGWQDYSFPPSVAELRPVTLIRKSNRSPMEIAKFFDAVIELGMGWIATEPPPKENMQ